MKISKSTLTKIIVIGCIIIAINIIYYVVMLFATAFGGIDVTKCLYDFGHCNENQQDKEDVKP